MECLVIKVSGHSHGEICNKKTNFEFQLHNNNGSLKQVDIILISKNHVLQTLFLKHHAYLTPTQ